MNDVNRVILVHHENHLEQAASTATAPDQPFVFLDLSWIGMTRGTDRPFRVFGRNTMFSNVLTVPVIPAEVNEFVMQENIGAVNSKTRRAKGTFLFVNKLW